ncbi:MAG: hypothetical protein R3342_05020 [Lutibacter sp.]|uniref:hypothetical protein n=1 Tax=Lutibacter sp. TaxID=1925666 RepID=UPI00299DC4BC|nr:hypothetical protein [Lutibacter sp.]MDX1828892.1 hypothetical protein [Lutibacter sp.]
MLRSDLQLKSGVVGGTILSAVYNIELHDVIITAVMAVIGAVVSFFVSYVLRKLFSDSNKSKKRS